MKTTPRIILVLLCACAAMLVVAAPSMAKHHASRGDRNHDGLPDSWERANKLSLHVNQARRDQDRDGLNNRGEFLAGTDPRAADTNGDGIDDGEQGSGTIVAFDSATGKLTIKPFNGDPVVGMVTADTEIECGDREEVEHQSAAQGATMARAADHGGGGLDDHGTAPGADDNQGADDNGGGDDQGQTACDATSLTAGMVVREAELQTTAAGLVFQKVEVVPTAPLQPAARHS